MIEKTGDLFTQNCDAICITTNGDLRKNGSGIMGAGIARQARNKWPELEETLGRLIHFHGNKTNILMHHERSELKNPPPYSILCLPTKNSWRSPSDLDLIRNSLQRLVYITTQRNWTRVCLTRPGCGLGGLNWETQVKSLCSSLLDDRFVIVTPR